MTAVCLIANLYTMIRLFQIVVFTCLISAISGCNGRQEKKPTLQGIKLGDIAPVNSNKQPEDQWLKTINLDIYFFEIPAENIGALENIWKILYTKPLQFNNQEAFLANSFVIGFGQMQIWDEVGNLLRAAGGKKIKTVSLLFSDDQPEDLSVIALNAEQDVFYISGESSMEGVTRGPGLIALRIIAKKIPTARGLCWVNATPVFTLPTENPTPQLAAIEKAREFSFNSASFSLKMSTGDFLFLGPDKYLSHQITLGSLFFSRPERKPVIRTFLLVCSRIVD